MKKTNKKVVVVDKNAPIFKFETKIKQDDVEKNYEICLKKPTRSMYSEADMFYSIQLNKYIKMGLLTAEQIAKRQIDVGGTFSDEQQKHYIELQKLLAEKQEMLLRIMSKTEISQDEEERKKNLISDTAILKNQLTDYEYIKNQIYEHTANAKARNDLILWWVLNLSMIAEIEEGKESNLVKMFEGETFDTRKLKLQEMEDNDNEIIKNVFSKLVRIVTLWYWMGVSDAERLKQLVEENE